MAYNWATTKMANINFATVNANNMRNFEQLAATGRTMYTDYVAKGEPYPINPDEVSDMVIEKNPYEGSSAPVSVGQQGTGFRRGGNMLAVMQAFLDQQTPGVGTKHFRDYRLKVVFKNGAYTWFGIGDEMEAHFKSGTLREGMHIEAKNVLFLDMTHPTQGDATFAYFNVAAMQPAQTA